MTSTFRNVICTLAATVAIPAASHSQTLNTIFNFERGKTGYHPIGSLAVDANGNLYGTTERGGEPDLGVAYELVPPASLGGAWTQLVLHSFTASGKGSGLRVERTRPRSAMLFRLRDGKVTGLKLFSYDRDRALADLGLAPAGGFLDS